MTNHANGSSMPQIEELTTALSTSAAFNEAVLTGAVMAGGKQNYVEVDYELYEDMLDDPSMSKADKRLLVDTLWSIVTSFVELGFGVHPVQQAMEAHDERAEFKSCGQSGNTDTETVTDELDCPIEEDAKGGPA